MDDYSPRSRHPAAERPASAQVSNLTCTSVTFSWNAATDNVGVAFYDVFHDGQLIKTVERTTTAADLSVVAGVRWGLYVSARDAVGNVSQASTTVYLTPPVCQVDTQPPTAPGDAEGVGGRDDHHCELVGLERQLGVRAYDVYRNTLGSASSVGTATSVVGTVLGTSTSPPPTSFVDSGLAPSTGYSYSIVARDAQSNASGHSASVTVTTGAACGDAVCGVSTVTTDTDIPWGLLTLPDGTILYSRRDAHTIVRLDPEDRGEDDGGHGAERGRAPTARAVCSGWPSQPASAPTAGSTSCTPRRATTGSSG